MTFLLYLTITLFILVSLFLILLVLIQKGRGGGLAGAFGGMGGNTAFGSKTGDVLTWATAIVFGVFVVLAIILNLMTNTSRTPRVTAGGAAVPATASEATGAAATGELLSPAVTEPAATEPATTTPAAATPTTTPAPTGAATVLEAPPAATTNPVPAPAAPTSLPTNGVAIAEGDAVLTYTAGRDGVVYVFNRTTEAVVFSGGIEKNQTMVVDPTKNQVTIDGRVHSDGTLRKGDAHRIFFSPGPALPAAGTPTTRP